MLRRGVRVKDKSVTLTKSSGLVKDITAEGLVMSGGHFDYKQYNIGYIADAIEDLILKNKDESKDYWGDTVGRFYSDETIEKFKTAVMQLRLAQIYAHRIDWLVSGDDSEDSFHRRLANELAALEE